MTTPTSAYWGSSPTCSGCFLSFLVQNKQSWGAWVGQWGLMLCTLHCVYVKNGTNLKYVNTQISQHKVQWTYKWTTTVQMQNIQSVRVFSFSIFFCVFPLYSDFITLWCLELQALTRDHCCAGLWLTLSSVGSYPWYFSWETRSFSNLGEVSVVQLKCTHDGYFIGWFQYIFRLNILNFRPTKK